MQKYVETMDLMSEKKLTPAELKKREEIAKAMERENPDMPMGKKMAIATATAKKVAEEKEGTEPKTEREKDLADEAEPKDKITMKDVLIKRGVLAKEEMEQMTPEHVQSKMQHHAREFQKAIMKKDHPTAAAHSMKFVEYEKQLRKMQNESVELDEMNETPTGIKIYHKGKTGPEEHTIVFSARDAQAHEKELKKMGHKVTGRSLMFGAKEGERKNIQENVNINNENRMTFKELITKLDSK